MSAWIGQGDVVLFQGDSITDAGRVRDNGNDLGRGYALMAAAQFSAKYPEKQVQFLNRGISGNRVVDLQQRWDQDCLNLKPNLVSIYIGINDTWRRYDRNDPTSTESFEAGYRDLLTQTAETGAKLVLIEPFVLPVPEDRKQWREDLDPKITVVRELAREFDARLVCLMVYLLKLLRELKAHSGRQTAYTHRLLDMLLLPKLGCKLSVLSK